ncbi:hypothetical protein DV702_05415 [Sporosarcina sp. PTS2304]|uniref:hypothetical protein n=1 Tax=Sporosarcina sp. PTS2304 TaxID=2283194 RepID=UPI000E0DC60E|nr:hypothetical protein [Sporosarcina sp. PTS2304]AXH99225.1 hypothetical protein DV702_05415 [Sporosarcina sp. PTS2304]
MASDLVERDRLEIELAKVTQIIDQGFEHMKSSNKFLPLMLGENIFHQEIAKMKLVEIIYSHRTASFSFYVQL